MKKKISHRQLRSVASFSGALC